MLYAYGVTVCVENSPTSNYTPATWPHVSRVTSPTLHIQPHKCEVQDTSKSVAAARAAADEGRGYADSTVRWKVEGKSA